jgi:hypothetical protein
MVASLLAAERIPPFTSEKPGRVCLADSTLLHVIRLFHSGYFIPGISSFQSISSFRVFRDVAVPSPMPLPGTE